VLGAPVDLTDLIALGLGQWCPDGKRAEGADSGTDGSHPLPQVALRHDLELDPRLAVETVEDSGVGVPGE